MPIARAASWLRPREEVETIEAVRLFVEEAGDPHDAAADDQRHDEPGADPPAPPFGALGRARRLAAVDVLDADRLAQVDGALRGGQVVESIGATGERVVEGAEAGADHAVERLVLEAVDVAEGGAGGRPQALGDDGHDGVVVERRAELEARVDEALQLLVALLEQFEQHRLLERTGDDGRRRR